MQFSVNLFNAYVFIVWIFQVINAVIHKDYGAVTPSRSAYRSTSFISGTRANCLMTEDVQFA